MKSLFNSFIIAFAMYSKIPMPRVDFSKENMRYAMCFFPAVGSIIGLIFYLWGRTGDLLFPAGALYHVVLMLIPVLITGGIHLDGLLDTSDALSSYQSRERKLEILKDSNAGAFAVIVGLVYFFLLYGVYSEITKETLGIIALGFMLSRSLSGLSIASFPLAKNTGLAAAFSDGAQKMTVRICTILWAAACVICMCAISLIPGIVCALSALAVFGAYYHISMKQFGGITGDLAGFFLQICELVMAFAVILTVRILQLG